ncbi:hypothetical protein [Paenibacillus sp. NAIST15-1]|uniref:hypothetical protein n=1 Tax=Paenibacillus sp. NAIST15-1 TaxID=1605994 RepID=UPI00086D60A0|nr:hypothetical protein [Paenibacillus sp. NAIST15-1]GAV11442.1 iron-dependent repressor ideR [Paenibacillus sp. NAIST15-1]
MKIDQKAIEQYQELCHLSAMKCETLFDIEYKIERAIALGQLIEMTSETKMYRYYNLNFVVKNNKVVRIYRSRSIPEVFINEKIKFQYDRIHRKILV